MSKQLPQSAFFLSPPVSENSGVDFLGLRQANLDMMADLIPGTNNVTPFIRPFSILSWIFWKFHELCASQSKLAPTNIEARAFRERIEILFTWGAQVENAPNIPGKSAEPPASTNGQVELTFEAWERVQNSTSLIAALWYGPASKTISGLGFLAPHRPELFRTTGKGILLATKLDEVLRQKPDLYQRLLNTLEPVKASENDATALWQLWGVNTASEEEQTAFRLALFDENAVGNYAEALGKRSSTIALARLQLSGSARPLTPDEVRQKMYYSEWDDVLYSIPEGLITARKKWITLQVRQLQRLAFETLLSWCEYKVLNGVHDTVKMTTDAETAFNDAEFGLPSGSHLGTLLETLDERAETIEQFAEVGRMDGWFCPFTIIKIIQEQFATMNDKAAASCLYAALLCASFAGCACDDDKLLVNVGGHHRLSTLHLRKRLIALGNVTLRQAIQFILEALVISQHMATAVNRFDGQNQRLRLSIEETGLEALVNKPWVPTVTEDRLPTILRLASNCGLIKNPSRDMFTT
ncbi:hypothetical protein [Cohaesibacter gelatinilyticus]|uniref:Uncharacterized protein n=1 Tax=Cohaesibacter gelatinilyticus TaxID=372072 RepID=A0A285PC68_9HYPH|nr:hypothetical protein [Cohaesibacter gelatinilyticus]SNZ19322.1 hypothetical protein SAMN06265368_2404 [Cohaesibacter gelatinilyticus]